MVMVSDNGWGCLNSDSKLLRDWAIGPVTLKLRSNYAGFVLAHLATWFDAEVEKLNPHDMPDYDDHGYGARYIGGGTSGVASNHWSATAVDLNAKRHPQGVPTVQTFTAAQIRVIRRKMEVKYPGVVWGGEWNRVDSMHFEYDELAKFPKSAVKELALNLVYTSIGSRVIAAQPEKLNWEKW